MKTLLTTFAALTFTVVAVAVVFLDALNTLVINITLTLGITTGELLVGIITGLILIVGLAFALFGKLSLGEYPK